MRGQWLLALAPAALGVILSAIFVLWLPSLNYFVLVRLQLSALAAIVGIGASALAVTALLVARQTRSSVRRAAAQEAAADRRRFLQRLDHELKNPLTAIMVGLANVADARNGERDEEQDPALASVKAQVQRLGQLVGDLRKLSDLERRELEQSAVDLSALLEEVFALAQEHPGASARRLNLVIPQAPWPLPRIYGDRDLLFLAIYNSLDNALKFTPEGGTIELRGVEADSGVEIEIADTGRGIPADEVEHIWDELYRGAGARGIPGSGLGLALVRAIVARHGGQTMARSRPGQGTLITLRLPVRPA